MKFKAAKSKVLNRGIPPTAFLTEMVEWMRDAHDEIFAINSEPKDIYGKVKPELSPWRGEPGSKEWFARRKAVMLEVMRVLAGFESSWDWTEGVDTSRLGSDTPENSEAGAWQVSYDARKITPELKELLADNKIKNGITFQQKMKFDHPLSMQFIARLLRVTTSHHGPLYKGSERAGIRKSLRGEEQSIYPWLRRDAVAEFEALLLA